VTRLPLIKSGTADKIIEDLFATARRQIGGTPNMAPARQWSSGKLGLDQAEEHAGGLRYRLAGGEFTLYESQDPAQPCCPAPRWQAPASPAARYRMRRCRIRRRTPAVTSHPGVPHQRAEAL
jgi:hypothetical protein